VPTKATILRVSTHYKVYPSSRTTVGEKRLIMDNSLIYSLAMLLDSIEIQL
jgi:hypothetical protein